MCVRVLARNEIGFACAEPLHQSGRAGAPVKTVKKNSQFQRERKHNPYLTQSQRVTQMLQKGEAIEPWLCTALLGAVSSQADNLSDPIKLAHMLKTTLGSPESNTASI